MRIFYLPTKVESFMRKRILAKRKFSRIFRVVHTGIPSHVFEVWWPNLASGITKSLNSTTRFNER